MEVNEKRKEQMKVLWPLLLCIHGASLINIMHMELYDEDYTSMD